MSYPKLIGIGIALALGASVALACGPDFPWQLLDNRSATLAATPSNSFAYEATHLIATPKDSLKAVELAEFQREQAAALFTQAEAEGLTAEQAAVVAEMRAANTGEEAFANGAIVPAAVRLYTAGAVDFIKAEDAKAAERFQAVLELPADDQRARAVWAAYMLGRFHKRAGDGAKATEAFAHTRALAIDGAPDPLGLAVASYGEEARLHLDRAAAVLGGDGALPAEPDAIATYSHEAAAATALYAEQAARGSDSGVQSLRMVAETLVEKPERISATVSDPPVQRLLVAYVLARERDMPQQSLQPDPNAPQASAAPNPLLVTLVEAIERSGLEHPAGADRLAALAYHMGQYDLAAALAAKAPSPLASWVKAKLALQRGDLGTAAGFYAEASSGFPSIGAAPSLEDASARLLAGEGGVVALARGDYIDALDKLYRVAETYWGDVAYVAERVLTVDELKRFVDAKVPQPPAPQTDTDASTDGGAKAATMSSPAGQLRDLLARRLSRAGRYQEALAYYRDAIVRDQAAQYAQALRGVEAGKTRVDRGRAWYAAALLARQAGMEMMGTEAGPDYSAYDGSFETGIGRETLDGPLVTDEERGRFESSAAAPPLRFHYRYIAVDEASQAADQLPPRSQAFAAVLCAATGWMMGTRDADQRAHDLYVRYVSEGPYVPWAANFGRDCPRPDFESAAQSHYLRDARNFLSRYRWPIGIGGLVAMGLIVAWLMRQRLAPAK
jgi:tetratricopeptide (TPR) repeat protein